MYIYLHFSYTKNGIKKNDKHFLITDNNQQLKISHLM